MITKITTNDASGTHTYIGHVLTKGPSVVFLVLTEPFSAAGHSVTIPMTEIVTEEVLAA